MKKALAMAVLLALAGCGKGGGTGNVEVPEVIHYPGLPPSPPKPKAIPFDDSVKSLGENFMGHDCREVANALRGKNVRKDQYESTKEFDARIEKLKEQAFYDDLKLGSQLIFVDRDSGIGIYDADKQVINYDAPYIGYNLTYGESHPKLTAFKKSKNERGMLVRMHLVQLLTLGIKRKRYAW